MALLQEAKIEQGYAKIGGFGPQGSGKTTAVSLLAIGASKTYHQNAPVAFFDTEKGSDFAKALFDAEGVKLLTSKSRALADVITATKEAEAAGCCALIVDSITHVWNEVMDAFCKKRDVKRPEFHHWREIKSTWRAWTDIMLNCRLHVFVAGRAGKEYEYQENEETGKQELISTGTKMQAEREFGYEPDILFELWTERADAAKRGSHLVHKALILKDRSWAINGQEFAWHDKAKYAPGDWKKVFDIFAPYFSFLHIGGTHRAIDTSRTSEGMFDAGGNSEYYRKQKERQVALENWDATMALLWPGSSAAEKRLRLVVGEYLTGVRSRTALENIALESLQRSVRVLQAFEQSTKGGKMPDGEQATLDAIEACKFRIEEEEKKGSAAGPF